MTDLLEAATLEISDQELDRLLEAAEDYCRRGGAASFDRRNRERYAFDRKIVIHRATADGEIASEQIDAQARDISLWGISMRAAGRYKRHDRLTIDLTVPRPQFSDRAVRLLVEVRHVKPDPSGDCILGCAFRETLSERPALTQHDLPAIVHRCAVAPAAQTHPCDALVADRDRSFF